MITVAIHQPNYIPWMGYFSKILKSDIFIFLDDVQYTKNGFINRNRIKNSQGSMWLTIPVKVEYGQSINQVSFSDVNWSTKHIKTLDACYRKAPYYENYREEVISFLEKPFNDLAELNKCLIQFIAEQLESTCRFISSSELQVTGRSDDRLVGLVKAVGGTQYLSGKGGANYQDESKFLSENILIKYNDFKPLVYQQLWGEFEPGLSILDALFNVGSHTKALLLNASENTGGTNV